jgi:hypothetical protein
LEDEDAEEAEIGRREMTMSDHMFLILLVAGAGAVWIICKIIREAALGATKPPKQSSRAEARASPIATGAAAARGDRKRDLAPAPFASPARSSLGNKLNCARLTGTTCILRFQLIVGFSGLPEVPGLVE